MVALGTTANNMPELPEVTTVIKTLENLVVGKTIRDIDVFRQKTIDSDIPSFKQKLIGKTIKSFDRVGKYLIFKFDKDYVLASHLRMEGKYFFRQSTSEITYHDLVIFYFTDGTRLDYNDTRRFGTMNVLSLENYKNEHPLTKVGPDPFMLNDTTSIQPSFNKNIPIKSVLLDQSIMSGLGNIYVDEVLYASKISPLTKAKDVNAQQLENILENSKKILKQAIIDGGSTIKSYHPAEGVSGKFQTHLKVYNKNEGICEICGTHFKKIFVGGRGTTYCPKCQANFSRPFTIGITGPIASGKSTVTRLLVTNNTKIYDADKIVKEIYSSKWGANLLISTFGKQAFDKEGNVNRDFLRAALISDPKLKTNFDKKIHSKVVSYIQTKIEKQDKNSIALLDVPLLYESGINELCDVIIFVDITKDTQLKHMTARGLDINSMRILNSNFKYLQNKEKSDYIVDNNKSLQDLNNQINQIKEVVFNGYKKCQ